MNRKRPACQNESTTGITSYRPLPHVKTCYEVVFPKLQSAYSRSAPRGVKDKRTRSKSSGLNVCSTSVARISRKDALHAERLRAVPDWIGELFLDAHSAFWCQQMHTHTHTQKHLSLVPECICEDGFGSRCDRGSPDSLEV